MNKITYLQSCLFQNLPTIKFFGSTKSFERIQILLSAKKKQIQL